MSNAQGVRTMNKNYLSVEKGHIPSFSSTEELMQDIKTNSSSFLQGLRTMNKKFLTFEKEHMQTDVAFSFSIDNVMESTPTFETSFSQGWRTTDKTALAHEKRVCILIFQFLILLNDDMNSNRDHGLGWMKELWNKWRGQLHANYVKGKPIQEALKNMPKWVEKKQWEWLARSNRNAINRGKLKMHHYICSKPIREIIYQKGRKDGNPPDLATIFYETRKKNNTLVDSETIEKHAQIQELVESEPSLSSIEIVEKCFGPQSRSHVFDFGGGVKARDLKGGASSKAELLAELRSTQKENQSLKDCISNFQKEMKELKQLKDFFLAQHLNFQPPIQENDYADTS
ncbi:hypothetical protein KY290_025089 [Solanum tuberosum]|uniref:TNP2-like transposon protein n=1 Tax=Solanum tuberosum TaxID=4113 RepID=A0ABQ7UST6_SOLTU|nr:hypothetical protein KY284_023939 [Solanum tuberosum]KAH0754819.1 hypothetical protein KY290_025089 [Solanum tuberosum]